jgi:REP element-mobilizing transposase RayT
MSSYRRPPVTGATVFFTVALAQRGSDLLRGEVALLRQAVRQTKVERPFDIEAWVVLPDHLHAIWRMPAGDRAYGLRWGAIKARFTRAVREKDVGWGFTPPMMGQLCREWWGGTPPYCRHRSLAKVMEGYGNAGSGNITFATKRIFTPICAIAG